MVSSVIISFVVFCTIAGISTGRFGIKRPFLFGFIIHITGLVSMYFVPSFFITAIVLFMITAGFAFFEVGANALASRIFIKNTAMLLNILHAFFGIGAFAAPIMAGLIVNAGIDWRMIYVLSIPLVIVLLIIAVIAKFPEDKENPQVQDVDKRKTFIDALKEPMVWMLAICLGFSSTIENTHANWGTMYFRDIYGIDLSTTGAAFLSAFFVSFTISRLLSGFVIERLGYMRSLVGMAVIVFFGFACLILLGARGIFLLPVLGFFIGPLWPTVMAVAIRCFGKDAPVMCSAVIAGGGTLNAMVQYMIGLTNSFFGPAWGYRSSLLYILIFIIMLIILGKKLKSKERVV